MNLVVVVLLLLNPCVCAASWTGKNFHESAGTDNHQQQVLGHKSKLRQPYLNYHPSFLLFKRLSSACLPRLRLLSSFYDDAEAQILKQKAEQLRKEIELFEQQRQDASLQKLYDEENKLERRRQRYSTFVPILKPDGNVVDELCFFSPRYKEDDASLITTIEASLPLGLILGESDSFTGCTVVDDVTEGGRGQCAGIIPGDILRACSACRMEMVAPTWQLIAGGIGQPKTKRFMYSVDNRPFEEVLQAISSNRMDPTGRPVVLVIERRESDSKL